MKLRVIILLAIAASAACHRESGTAPVVPAKPKAGVKAAAANPRGPSAQEMTAGMVEAVVQSKSQAPIDLKFDLLGRPVEGQPLEVAIALLPQIAAGSATVSVTGSDGLQLGPGEEQFEFAALEAAQVYRHSIKLIPTANGLYLLTLSVSLQHDQTSDSRVFSVPILVGSAAAVSSAPRGPRGS
ncbi:MAG: hypothetical protein ABSG30_18240 [Steroidobacteraceae bacterium]|jgi:hypothetical protein